MFSIPSLASLPSLLPADVVLSNEAFDQACFDLTGMDQEFLSIQFSFGEGESIPGEIVASVENWFLVKDENAASIVIVSPQEVDAYLLILLDECARKDLEDQGVSFEDQRWGVIGSRMALVHKHFPSLKQ